jgi:hypothetical protein
MVVMMMHNTVVDNWILTSWFLLLNLLGCASQARKRRFDELD